MTELPDEIYERIEALSEQGNVALEENDDPDAAIEAWTQALDLLPEPKNVWDAFSWLHGSIGEAHRQRGNHPAALRHFEEAASSGPGVANPFLLLRLGQSLRAVGHGAEAEAPLLKAYMMDGETVFEEDGIDDLRHLQDRGLI